MSYYMGIQPLVNIRASRQKTKATSKRLIEDGFKAADGVALLLAVAIDVGLENSLTWSHTCYELRERHSGSPIPNAPQEGRFFVPKIHPR